MYVASQTHLVLTHRSFSRLSLCSFCRPLSQAVGYIVVLGFGALFSIFTTVLVFLDKYFGRHKEITSEHFK